MDLSTTDHPPKRHAARAVAVIGISTTGWLLSAGISIVLARYLGTSEFQQFVYAVAVISLVGTVCEFGVGKYAMQVMPQYVRRRQWELAAGYLYFSCVLTTLASMVCLLAGFGLGGGFSKVWSTWTPLTISMLFLPAVVSSALVSEFLMASRKVISGSIILRLVCPGMTLAIFVVSMLSGVPLSAGMAIMCYGLGSVVGLVVAICAYWSTAPIELFRARPKWDVKLWLKNAIWFAAIATVSSWLPKLSLIVLKASHSAGIETARFAAALEISSFVLLIAKSTNKYYSPELALIMADSNWDSARSETRKRLWLIASISAAFLVVVVLFGRTMLGWFGAEFTDGYAALCFMTVGTCSATTFSMAPEYLKFAGQQRYVMTTYFVAGFALIILTYALAAKLGATGAGLAFGTVLLVTALSFRTAAIRSISKEGPN